MSITPISEHFENYFQIFLAHTPELLEQVYKIRYDVYCREFHFEREEDHSNGLEKDEYDQYSLHCLIVHKMSRAPAGCVRLIKIPRNNPSMLLPLERFCSDSLSHSSLHPRRLRRSNLCEVSRLAVHNAFRRRRGESASPLGSHYEKLTDDASEEELRTFPLISIALIYAATSLSLLAHRPDAFVMIEDWLARLLQRMGLNFVKVGDPIDYHGYRTAFHITPERVIRDMRGDMRGLYDFVDHSLTTEANNIELDITQ